MTVRITAKAAPGRYKGRRARRAAFADRTRIARLLGRVVANMGPHHAEVVADAWLDALVHGSGWYKVSADGFGMVCTQRIAPHDVAHELGDSSRETPQRSVDAT